jgi:RES domain-containing protein
VAGLRDFLVPWSGSAYRHIPAGAQADVLDFRALGWSADNRWNFLGERTLYLASDRAVAIAEFGRHYREDTSAGLQAPMVPRQIYRLQIEIQHLLDLRDPALLELLAIDSPPYRLLDRRVARAIAHYLRFVTAAQAILVPSVAFLDDVTRWVGVLFLEKLPDDPGAFVTAVEPAGVFRLDE